MTDDEQARYWNGAEAAHWLVHEERYERRPRPLIAPNEQGRYERLPDEVTDRFEQFSPNAQLHRCTQCRRVVGLR